CQTAASSNSMFTASLWDVIICGGFPLVGRLEHQLFPERIRHPDWFSFLELLGEFAHGSLPLVVHNFFEHGCHHPVRHARASAFRKLTDFHFQWARHLEGERANGLAVEQLGATTFIKFDNASGLLGGHLKGTPPFPLTSPEPQVYTTQVDL